MQLTTHTALGTPAAIRVYRSYSRGPSIRLEEEEKEETKIRELEIGINDARDDGERASLFEDLQRTFKSWIDRLDREINDAKSEQVRDTLKRKRERANSNYKRVSNP